MCYEDKNIIGYCNYCKERISKDEPYVVYDEMKYHRDCFEQMNLYIDSFGDNIPYDYDE
jgi:hypothetical protein